MEEPELVLQSFVAAFVPLLVAFFQGEDGSTALLSRLIVKPSLHAIVHLSVLFILIFSQGDSTVDRCHFQLLYRESPAVGTVPTVGQLPARNNAPSSVGSHRCRGASSTPLPRFGRCYDSVVGEAVLRASRTLTFGDLYVFQIKLFPLNKSV